jgi:hypothetical protein
MKMRMRMRMRNIRPDGGTGRRAGLKNQWEFSLAGSIPAPGTKSERK